MPHLSRRRLCAPVLSAVLAAAGLYASPGLGSPAASAATAVPCGQVLYKSDGTRWQCTLDDEFTGTRLDSSRWTEVSTEQSGFHVGAECYVPDDSHVRVGAGHLTLTMTRGITAPCGPLTTPYRSGMITSHSQFVQTYGRFEFRARMAGGIGLHSALWLYPQDATGPWPTSGEIDVAELWGSMPRYVFPRLHYVDADRTLAHPGAACRVDTASTAYHVYTVTWTPNIIGFAYDGRPCAAVTGWTPALPQVHPAPFDRPFALNLELALDSVGPNRVTADTPGYSTMTVDYVRVWR